MTNKVSPFKGWPSMIGLGILSVALLSSIPVLVKAQQGSSNPSSQQENTNCAVSSVTTNSCSGGSVLLIAPTNTPTVCFGSPVSVSVTTSNILGQQVVQTSYSNCPPTIQTNSMSPTIVSNWWTASGPGSFSASGSGLSATFTPTNGGTGSATFNATYTDGCDTNIETASPVSVSYNVIQITNQCVASTPTNRGRTTIGVGEEVNISLVGPPSGTFTWSTSAGSVSPTTGTATTLTAPSNSATATITVNYSSGSCTLPFSVLEPSGIASAQIASTVSFPVNDAGVGMHLSPVIIGPTNVSFYRVQIVEVGEAAIDVTGYFALNPPPSHVGHGADVWFTLNEDNSWPAAWDWAQSAVCPPPWSAGGFTWPIPGNWRIGSGPTNSLTGWSQTFSITADGTMTVTKFGHSATRTTNDVYTTH